MVRKHPEQSDPTDSPNVFLGRNVGDWLSSIAGPCFVSKLTEQCVINGT